LPPRQLKHSARKTSCPADELLQKLFDSIFAFNLAVIIRFGDRTWGRRDSMHPRDLQGEYRTYVRAAFAMVTLLIVGLAGCASELTPRPSRPPADAAPYVGVFTGEFVDGKPLYRFPTIEVVGSRSTIGPGT
jgi:hypothetical protein